MDSSPAVFFRQPTAFLSTVAPVLISWSFFLELFLATATRSAYLHKVNAVCAWRSSAQQGRKDFKFPVPC